VCTREFALKSFRKSIHTHRGPQDQSKNLALVPSNFLNFAAAAAVEGRNDFLRPQKGVKERELKMFLDEVIFVQKHSFRDCMCSSGVLSISKTLKQRG
jgi:hypothetical protein